MPTAELWRNQFGGLCLGRRAQALVAVRPSRLSDPTSRAQNSAGRGQILTILQVNSHSSDQESGEIGTGQVNFSAGPVKSCGLAAHGSYLVDK